jgi:hypothetical protein
MSSRMVVRVRIPVSHACGRPLGSRSRRVLRHMWCGIWTRHDEAILLMRASETTFQFHCDQSVGRLVYGLFGTGSAIVRRHAGSGDCAPAKAMRIPPLLWQGMGLSEGDD